MAGKLVRSLAKLVSIGTYNSTTCIPDTMEKLVAELINRLGIEIPGQDTDTFVTISVTAPTDKTRLWLATNSSGNVISLRKFVENEWQEILPVGLGMLLPFYGDPALFTLTGWAVANGAGGTDDTQSAWGPIIGGKRLFYATYVGK